METFDDPAEALSYPREALLRSSRDDERRDGDGCKRNLRRLFLHVCVGAGLGALSPKFLLQDGSWKGAAPPEGYVSFMRTRLRLPAAITGGQVWLQENGIRAGTANFPPDTFGCLDMTGRRS